MMYCAVRNMMLLASLAMMRCLPQTLGEADIISVSGIISETTSFAEGKHHSKRPLLSGRQKWSFCWRRLRDLNPRYGVHRIHDFQSCSFGHSDKSANIKLPINYNQITVLCQVVFYINIILESLDCAIET